MITREDVVAAFKDIIRAMPTEPGVEGCLTVDCIIINENEDGIEAIPVDYFVLLFGGAEDLSAKSLHAIVDGQQMRGLPVLINKWQAQGYFP